MNKELDLEADTIKVALLDSNHSFTATDNTWSQIVSNQISGTGYTSGGATLSNKAVTQGATTKWDADDVSWSSASFTAAFAVIYDDSTGTDDLIACYDLGGNQTVSTGTFTIQHAAAGIITLV